MPKLRLGRTERFKSKVPKVMVIGKLTVYVGKGLMGLVGVGLAGKDMSM